MVIDIYSSGNKDYSNPLLLTDFPEKRNGKKLFDQK